MISIPTFEQSSLYESLFWLQVMGDHARFILGALSVEEAQEIPKAQYFIAVFDNLLDDVRNNKNITGLLPEIVRETEALRDFKIHLLKRGLIGDIKINLSPTFFNHMLNELQEFLLVLTYLSQRQSPPVFNPLHYHLLWVLDGAGHAASIAGSLDEVEEEYIKTARMYEDLFMKRYHKAVEFNGYMRTGLDHFPALDRYNDLMYDTMNSFMDVLDKLKHRRISKEILGTITPLMADHMWREECYYLTKLSAAGNVPNPDCDATKPRIET